MARYIDADELVNKIFMEYGVDPYYCKSGDIDGLKAYTDSLILERVNTIPTADVKPVVHAHWTRYIQYGKRYPMCSNCEYAFTEAFETVTHYNEVNYCPHCGAIMDGEDIF